MQNLGRQRKSIMVCYGISGVVNIILNFHTSFLPTFLKCIEPKFSHPWGYAITYSSPNGVTPDSLFPSPESVRTVFRVYAEVITKFSQIHRFPCRLNHQSSSKFFLIAKRELEIFCFRWQSKRESGTSTCFPEVNRIK